MDTQIKILKEVATYEDDKPIGTPNECLLDFANLRSPLFAFKEAENIFLTFQFDESLISMKYESYENGEMVAIKANTRIHFSSGRDTQGCYFAGEFSIEVECANEKYALLFNVEPNNLKYETVFHLREYVNAYYSGLSLDILKNRSGYMDSSMKNGNASFYDSYLLLTSKFPQMLMQIGTYVNMKHTTASKQQTYAHASMKLSSNSLKWLSSKGMSKNDNIYSPHTLLVKKTKHELDNEQNQFFKAQLLFWNNELRRMICTIKMYRNSVLNEYNVKINERDEQSIKLDNIQKQLHNASKKSKINEQNKLEWIDTSIKDLKKMMVTYNGYIEIVEHYKVNLEFYLYSTWMENVSDSKRTMIRNQSFQGRALLELRNEYEGMQNYGRIKKKESTVSFLSEKGSPKLFETYVFVLLINILKNKGFCFEDENDIANSDLMYLFSNPCKLSMVNDDIYCDIIYDKEIRKSNAKFVENEYCTINSYHNRPDFILSFHKDKTRGKPLTALVVEVKWRSLNKIYNEMATTDVMEALSDYYNLGYYVCENKKPDRAVIKKVIALYPDEEERKVDVQNNDILAIGIFPCENMSEQKGYFNLVDEIDKILAECIIV